MTNVTLSLIALLFLIGKLAQATTTVQTLTLPGSSPAPTGVVLAAPVRAPVPVGPLPAPTPEPVATAAPVGPFTCDDPKAPLATPALAQCYTRVIMDIVSDRSDCVQENLAPHIKCRITYDRWTIGMGGVYSPVEYNPAAQGACINPSVPCWDGETLERIEFTRTIAVSSCAGIGPYVACVNNLMATVPHSVFTPQITISGNFHQIEFPQVRSGTPYPVQCCQALATSGSL